MSRAEAIAFVFGVVIGAGACVVALWPKQKVCPEVDGSKVVTSYHVGDGHYCVYERSSQGRAKRVIKL